MVTKKRRKAIQRRAELRRVAEERRLEVERTEKEAADAKLKWRRDVRSKKEKVDHIRINTHNTLAFTQTYTHAHKQKSTQTETHTHTQKMHTRSHLLSHSYTTSPSSQNNWHCGQLANTHPIDLAKFVFYSHT